MKHMAVIFSVLIALGVLVGCSNKEKSSMPAELPVLAEKFKSMDGGADKIELGKKIMKLLPTCMRPSADGGLAKIDYANPTYVLNVQDLYSLMGQPSETGPDFCVYDLGKGEKTSYFLLIDLYDDYVSSARIDVGK